MEAKILRWVFSVFYGSLTFFKAVDEFYFFNIEDLPLIFMAIGAVMLVVVNRKDFADNLRLALISLLLILASALIYDLSWFGIDTWGLVVRLLFSTIIFVLFYLSKGKESVPIKDVLKDYSVLRLTEKSFFKDKVSILFAIIMGSSVGIGWISFMDAVFRDNGPYRVPFDLFMTGLSPIILVCAFILYIVCLVRSGNLPVSTRLEKLAFVCVLAALIIIPSSILWSELLELVQTVKGLIYYELMGNVRT